MFPKSINSCDLNIDQNNPYSCLVFSVGPSRAAENARSQLLIHFTFVFLPANIFYN